MSTDGKSSRHRLTPEGLKPDSEKIKAIVDMKPLSYLFNHSKVSMKYMVNYLKRFNPVLTELSEPLRRLQKQVHSLGMGI